MMEMGARCPSKFLAPKIEEFPRMKHFCWEFGYTELWDTTILHTEKELFTPPFFFVNSFPRFCERQLQLTYSLDLNFTVVPTHACLHGIEQSRWTLPKVHFDPKEQRGILNLFSSYILLPFWNTMYIWKCTSGNAQLGSKKHSNLAARFFSLASIINHDRLRNHTSSSFNLQDEANMCKQKYMERAS